MTLTTTTRQIPTVASTDVRTDRIAATPTWRVAMLAGVAAAAATELFALAARGAGVPMRAGSTGADHAEAIPAFGFASTTLMFAVVGTVFAVVLGRKSTHAAAIYTWTTTAVVAVSLLGPAFAGSTTTATKVVLAVAHVLAGAVVIPVVRRRLATSSAH
jgi:hypothetical protein